MVRIHAHTMRPANPQRTAESRLVAPTPTIEPVIVCVVLTGIPQCVASWIAIAPPVSAANFNHLLQSGPCDGEANVPLGRRTLARRVDPKHERARLEWPGVRLPTKAMTG